MPVTARESGPASASRAVIGSRYAACAAVAALSMIVVKMLWRWKVVALVWDRSCHDLLGTDSPGIPGA